MKRVRLFLVSTCALALLAAAHGATARDTTVADLRIVHAYARATPPGARTAAAYLTIESTGAAPDRLLGARSAKAAAVELHAMAHEGGMMRMRAVPHVDVPPRGSVRLEPGGLHLMIVDPRTPLRAGEPFPVTLTFARAGSVDVELDVEPLVSGK